jgi:uncharacterized protein (TIGR03000 family)
MTSRFAAAAIAATLIVVTLSADVFGQYETRSQQGWPFAGGGSISRPSGSYYVPPVSSPVVPATSATSATTTAPDTGFISTETPRDDTAVLSIRLPADAKLFFGNTEASVQNGAVRMFRSPALDPRSNYQYELRARWMENGQQVERTRMVPIRANQVVNVDFTRGG